MGTTAAYALDDALSAVAILASVTATMLTFWLGHAYAEVVAERVGRVRALPLGEVGDVLRAEWSFVVAVLPTALALGLTGVGVWSRDTGVSVALALGVTALAGWGALIGRRSHATWPSTLVLALVTASLGLAIVGLKVALR